MRLFDRVKSALLTPSSAALRESPRVFFVLAGVFFLLDIVILYSGQEPSYCMQNGVHVCSNWVPSVSAFRIAVVFILLAFAAISAYHGYELQDESHRPLRKLNDWLG